MKPDKPAAPSSPATPLTGKGDQQVRATLITESPSIRPGGTITAAIVLDVAKDWHVYWPGQNDTGVPVEVTFKLPEGWQAGAIGFPVPERHVAAGEILDHILEGKVVLTVPITAPPRATVGSTVPLEAEVNYLVCSSICKPGRATVKATLKVEEKPAPPKPGPSSTGDDASVIRAALEAQPKVTGWQEAVTTEWKGDTLVVTAKEAGVTKMVFAPSQDGVALNDPLKSGESQGNTLRLPFALPKVSVDGKTPNSSRVKGLVILYKGNKLDAYALDLPRLAVQPAGKGGTTTR